MIDDITLILDSSVRIAATLLFAALGELVAERAGTLNISVEGAMLSSAFGRRTAAMPPDPPTTASVSA